MRLRTYRQTSQVVFTVLTLGGLLGIGTTGVIYPYFFCYSCPWDVGACPIGILEHSFVDFALPNVAFMTGFWLLMFLLGVMFLIGIIFGRALCGWACPIGLMQDISKKFGISKRVNKKLGPKEIDQRTKYIKYIILISIPITSYYTYSLFYTTFCPVGGITGTVPTLLFYGGEWLLGTTFLLKFVSVALFLALIILVTRGWCKYLCPVGAMLAPWNKASFFRINRDEKTCNDCGLCEHECPMDVKDIGKKADMECILCGRCVGSCRKESLKIGSRFKAFNIRTVIPFFLVVLITSAMLFAGAFAGGYERTDAINDIPCLGCLALDPKSPEGWFSVEGELPGFIMEPLADGPVIIDYRTVVCAACDEMDPHVHDLAEEYEGRVHFFMHPENFENRDETPKDSDEYKSYFIFDVKGVPEKITGVPMFPIITYGLNETGEVSIIFKVLYGSSADGGVTQKANIAHALDEAIALYDDYGGGAVYYSGEHMPFVELFVDTHCTNCPDSEHALVDLADEEVSNFISYVTDADGISGAIAREREIFLYTTLDVPIGHPWAVFGGGPIEEIGALSKTAVYQNYKDRLNESYIDPLNVSISGEMIDNGNDLLVNVTATNYDNSSQSVRVQVFLLEIKSRWPNVDFEPIPNAVVDVLVNQTYDIIGGGNEVISVVWNGTDVFGYTDFRLSNLAVAAVVWHDDSLVTSKFIGSGVPELMWITTVEPVKATLPNNTATFKLRLNNYQDVPMTVNLSAKNVPSNLAINISQTSLTIGANSYQIFDVNTIGLGTMDGDLQRFIVEAQDVTDPTMLTSVGIRVEVKDDITPPVILQPTHSPELARADEEISISVNVGDNVGLESVTLYYYSCDDFVCSPTFAVNMTLGGGGYVPEEVIKPAELYHNIFHYWITAVDPSGNSNTTIEYDITLEPVAEPGDDGDVGGPSPFNTYGIGLVLVFAMVAIGLNVARVTRKDVGPKAEKKKMAEEEAEEESEEEFQ